MKNSFDPREESHSLKRIKTMLEDYNFPLLRKRQSEVQKL